MSKQPADISVIDSGRGRPATRSTDATSKIRRTFVHGIEVVASVGVYQHEHHFEQRIIISLDLDIADHYDGRSDKIADVYNYESAIKAARVIAASGHFNLIETLAERIAEVCLEHPDVLRVAVRIEKPDVVDCCGAVGIEIVRQSSE